MENFLEEKIPFDIKRILIESGFDTTLSLRSITHQTINNIEEYINNDPETLEGTSYDKLKRFQFRPGHRVFLNNLPQMIHRMNEVAESLAEPVTFNLSYVLKMLIETAQKNSDREPKGWRYHEVIRYYATYVYLLCGKQCYEVLCSNLPLPKAGTIRMYSCILSI